MNTMQIFLQAAEPSGGGSSMWITMLLVMVVFYVFMILPQTRKNKKAKKFLEELKKGDKVVTTGGIHGKVIGMTDKVITIQCEGETKFQIEKSGISAELSHALNS
jgi:preprotein translocase subunit YajC